MLKTEKKKLLYCSQHKNSPEGKKMAHPTREIFLLCVLFLNQTRWYHGPMAHSRTTRPAHQAVSWAWPGNSLPWLCIFQ
jgi:hypothetical protein